LARGGDRVWRPGDCGPRLLETARGLAAGPGAGERAGDHHRRAEDRHPGGPHRLRHMAAHPGHAPGHGPLAPLLSVVLMLKNYRTDVPLETFQAMTYVSLAMGALFGFLLMAGAAALVATFYPDAVPALRQRNRAAMAFDAVAALLAAGGLALAVHQFQGILLDRFHAQAVLSIASPDIIASAAPALAAVANAVRGLLTDGALLGLAALLAWQLPGPAKQWRAMRYGAALLALCATLPSEVRTPGEFLLHYGISLAMAGAGIAFCWFFARRNYLAYALVIWLMALRTPMMQLFGSGNRALEMQAWTIGAIMAATLVWVVAPAVLRRANP